MIERRKAVVFRDARDLGWSESGQRRLALSCFERVSQSAAPRFGEKHVVQDLGLTLIVVDRDTDLEHDATRFLGGRRNYVRSQVGAVGRRLGNYLPATFDARLRSTIRVIERKVDQKFSGCYSPQKRSLGV